jgi:PAS domain S-box-containing protein
MGVIARLVQAVSKNWWHYLAGLILVALATWLKYLAQPNIIPSNVPILYLVAIVPTAIFFGFGPAILVCLLSLFAYDYLFIPPLYEFNFLNITNAPILVIFLAVGVLFSYLTANLRRKNLIASAEISDRKRIEAELVKYRDHLEDVVRQRTSELEQEKNLLQTIMNSAGRSNLVYLDRDFNFIRVNIAYAMTCGYTPEGMVGKNHFALYPHEENEAIFRRVRDTGVPEEYHDKPFEFPDQPERGVTYWDWTLTPVKDERGQVQGLVFSLTETTERKKAQEKLQQYTAELELANKELEAFSYSVSHDLRAPLRALDGFSQAVIEDYGDKLDETGQDYLNRIRQASQTMAQLIDDMLQLSRVIRAEMNRDNVNFSDLAVSIVDELKLSQPDRQVEFIIAPDVTVTGDRQLLQILLHNLLENAWKYTGKCPNARIEVGVAAKDGKPVYFIQDNGVGFNMEYASKLFQPFQRLHSEKEYPGTGIGLAIVQRVVARHGGRIWAKAEPGKGAAFYFTLG